MLKSEEDLGIDLPDDVVDEETSRQLSKIDWNSVTKEEASKFGLSLGLYRDQRQLQRLRNTAYRTAWGTVVSMTMLTVVCQLFQISCNYIIIALLVSQAGRMLLLMRKDLRSNKNIIEAKQDVKDIVNKLHRAHPSQ